MALFRVICGINVHEFCLYRSLKLKHLIYLFYYIYLVCIEVF